MKTFKFLILSLFIFGAVSCSSDDDDSISGTDGSMTGKWYPTVFKIEGNMNVEGVGQMEYTAEGMGDFNGIYIDFKDDGTYFAENNTFPVKVMVKLNGDVINNDEFDTTWDLDQEGEWERNGEIVTISDDEGVTDYELLQLTSSKLKMQTNQGMIEGVGDDFPDDMDMTIRLEFKR